MHIQRHPLPSSSLGTSREVVSFHYGSPGGRKVYIQSSLHADELPGMLVAHKLRSRLEALEANGAIDGEIIVVPVANPVGLAQAVHGQRFGRFDLATGINFNRGYRYLVPELKKALEGRLGTDPEANVRTIRRAMHELLASWQPATETDAMKKTLFSLAVDADIVLDLHCDHEAVMHLYTGTPLAERAMPLARLLGAKAVLLATESGDEPFDEACSRTWWELAEHFGEACPVPNACLSVTVEFRGETDVRHEDAERDADAIVDFLAHEGIVKKQIAALPAAQCEPTPLEGMAPIDAPHGGLLVFVQPVGTMIEKGTKIADLIDPIAGTVTELKSPVAGMFFARASQRYVLRGMGIARVAGSVAFRRGKLLTA
jgi:predicted deacylase